MKRILLFFPVLFILTTFALSQVKITPRLMENLENAGSTDYVRILVYMRDQVDIVSIDQKLYEENATLHRRAYEVITALQEKANTTQSNLTSYLEAKVTEGKVFDYKPFWVANMLMVEAQPEVIQELFTRMDIAELDLDAFLELDRPIVVEEDAAGIESVEPGIRIINAHLLWQLGITGAGRIVMNIDTGVFPNHPALNFKWRGTHVPSNQAWFDPEGGTTTPNECDGHGSHTMGTMTGWSPITGDTVGVAPGAEWIAAKTICSSPHTSNSIAAFQWAMDPDENPSTTDDMPDVISCSWWDPNATNECDVNNIYRTTLIAVEAAGIAVVFSGGNIGPGPSTITSPKNINTNVVNTFSITAIDGASYLGGSNDPIASFSSHGPSICGGTGSLLIKPEVVAPGVSVRSSGTPTGYVSWSGSSMAAPHVAGAVALLKEFAPNLTGKQILETLYYTAKDLGTAGEDNTYGMGLIDVYAAFLSLGEPDTIPPDPISDLNVTEPASGSLTLTWTVPNDTTINGVNAYDIRYSTSPINDTIDFNNATPVTFTGIPDTIGAAESIDVEGLDFSTTYYFRVISRDIWGNWSALSNQASGTTLGAPAASVSPMSVYVTLLNNTTETETVTLSNISPGSSSLDYQISLENNTFPEGIADMRLIPKDPGIVQTNEKDNPEVYYSQSFFGSGGPDEFGYKWIDSNEPNGPQYVWEDITATGTQVTNWIPTGTLYPPKDEGYAGPFPIGFNFKFYGITKTQVYVATNGFLHFDPLTANTFANVAIPDTAHPNDFIAPFWDDLNGEIQGTVHYKQDGSRFIIQFTNWQIYGTTSSLTFQVVLHSSGEILYYYNNMAGMSYSATVGIENQDGTIGLQIAYNSGYIENNLAVQISAEPNWLSTNPLSGRLYNGNSVDIELTFVTEDFPNGDYSMDMVVSSNDPVNPEITVPVTMQIVPIPVELSLFRAETEKNRVILNWATASEVNNQGFEVERKVLSTEYGVGRWEKVGYIEGKGSTTENQSYSYTNNNLNVGKYIYRLKQIDYDGSYEYSPEVEVEVLPPQEYTLMQNYPNPFNPTTTIEYTLPENAEVRIEIYSVLGELVTTLVNNRVEAGYQKLSFDAYSLPSGTYIYRINAMGETKSFVDSKKMLLVK